MESDNHNTPSHDHQETTVTTLAGDGDTHSSSRQLETPSSGWPYVTWVRGTPLSRLGDPQPSNQMFFPQNETKIHRKIAVGDVSNAPGFVTLEDFGYVAKSTGPLMRLNISGTIFVVKVSTLKKDQIVFDKILEDAEYIHETKEYYFERDPGIFQFVLCYLRHQELHLPVNICGPLLEKELSDWGIQVGLDLQRCCLGPVMETKSKMESLKSFEEAFSESKDDYVFKPGLSIKWQRLRNYVWRIITDTPKKRWLGLLLNKQGPTEESNVESSDRFRTTDTENGSNKEPYNPNDNQTENDGGDACSINISERSQVTGASPFNWRTLQKTPKEILMSRAYVSLEFIVVAMLVTLMTISYLPQLREPFGPDLAANTTINSFVSFPAKRSLTTFDNVTMTVTRPKESLRILIWTFAVLYTIDFILRGVFCPRFWHWLKSFYTISDILSLVPFYLEGATFFYISTQIEKSSAQDPQIVQLIHAVDLLNLLKVFLLCRIFRLLQRQRPTRVLIYTIRTVATNIIMVFELMLLCAIFFGTAIFFIDPTVKSIFIGIWWAFTTMTTVGYGDVAPETIPGRLVAVMCMIVGILLTSYTIPVLVNDFLLFYGHADQLAWMRRVHKTAAAKRRSEKRDLMAKRRIAQVRTLLKHAVIGIGGSGGSETAYWESAIRIRENPGVVDPSGKIVDLALVLLVSFTAWIGFSSFLPSRYGSAVGLLHISTL